MVTIIKKYTGGAYPFYEYACLSTDVKPVDLVPENSICHEIDTGKHFYCANGAWHELPPRSGSEDGGGLPDNFPAEGSANANKFLGFDANGDYTAKDAPSGGGAEKFVVTLTQSDSTWSADKTLAEIVAADAAGKIVECKLEFADAPFAIDIPITIAAEGAVIFSGSSKSLSDWDANAVYSSAGAEEHDSTTWEVSVTPIPTSSNAPLIVTLTEGQEAGQFVGDKTYKEVYDAFIAGKAVVASITLTIEGNQIVNAFNVTSVGYMEGQSNEYNIMYSTTNAQNSGGSANDNLTITVGN